MGMYAAVAGMESGCHQRERERERKCEWGRERKKCRRIGEGEMEETMVTRQGWREMLRNNGPGAARK